MAVDWQNSLNWQPGYSFKLPTDFELARGNVPDGSKGAEYKFAANDQNARLLSQLGYGGQALDNGTWSNDARTWLQNQGYTVGAGYVPGSSPGGRAEFNGLLDSSGKFVQGQSDPTQTTTDTLMDNITPFLMMLPMLGGIAGAAGAGAEVGAGAGAVGVGGDAAAGIGTLGAADTGVTALGAGMSPSGLGLTGLGASEASTALSGLGSLTVPGAVEVGAGAAGAGGLASAGGGTAEVGSAAAAAPGAYSPAMNYGEGMTGLQTSAYDNTLGLTGSKGIADTVANSPLGSSIWSSPTTKSLADMFSSYGSNSGWLDLIKGGMSLYQASQMGKQGSTPWGQAAGTQLASVLNDPSSITKLPGYEAGLQAVQRSGAANGYLGSGNMMVGLQKYAGDFYNNTLRQLSSIANEGRGVDQQYNFASTALTGHAINNFGYGLTKLFGD